MQTNRENGWTIVLRDARKAFGKHVVLDGISWTFSAGKIYGIVGFNGCGKTVLLKCLCGMMPLDAGEAVIRQGDRAQGDKRGLFGIVIETAQFLEGESGMGNLKMLADIQGKIGRPEIAQTMQRVGLDPKSRMRVGKYSLGMRQRLAIAQAVMEGPPVLLLDEPLNGLDHESVRQVYGLIEQSREAGKVVLIASHHMEDIQLLCDEVLWLKEGKLHAVPDVNAYLDAKKEGIHS